jgi:hypothetical protein
MISAVKSIPERHFTAFHSAGKEHTSYADAPKGSLKIYLRMYGLERNRLKTLKQIIREKATILYMVDHRENIREIYFDTDCERPGFDTI